MRETTTRRVSESVATVTIPGNIILWQPIHTIQRDERYFKDAKTFYPERWFDDKQAGIKDKRVFIPFSYGSYKCIGNNLAMMEMLL